MLSIYLDLMKQGWTLNDIDTMDIFYYFEILAYRMRTEGNIFVGIDQIL